MLKGLWKELAGPIDPAKKEGGQQNPLAVGVFKDLTAPVVSHAPKTDLAKVLADADKPLSAPSKPSSVGASLRSTVLDFVLPAGYTLDGDGKVVKIEGGSDDGSFASLFRSKAGQQVVPEAAQTVADATAGLFHDLNSPITARITVGELEAQIKLRKERLETAKKVGKVVGTGAVAGAKMGIQGAKAGFRGARILVNGVADFVGKKVADRKNGVGKSNVVKSQVIDAKFKD